MSLELQEASPPTEGTAIAVPSRLYLAERPAARAAIPEYCPATPRRVNVQSVGGSDAVLAARLVVGDDYALAEAFDALARSVYASALGVLGDKSAAQDVVQPGNASRKARLTTFRMLLIHGQQGPLLGCPARQISTCRTVVPTNNHPEPARFPEISAAATEEILVGP